MRGRGKEGQPPRGSIERPYSALNLRLLLAAVGVAICVGLGVLAMMGGYPVPALVLGGLAVIGVVDIVVVLVRRRQRGSGGHSLFE